MDKQLVSRNLFKKLSALRATLTDEEQQLLDSMLVGQHEISAHSMSMAKTTAKTTDVDEVAAHGMTAAKTTAQTSAITSKVALRVIFDEDEEVYTVE